MRYTNICDRLRFRQRRIRLNSYIVAAKICEHLRLKKGFFNGLKLKDYSKALNYCFLLLKYRPRSEAELKMRLKKKGYSPSLAAQALDYLRKQKYIDDKEFVHVFVASSFNKGWGRRKIDMALKRFGIAEDLREPALYDKEAYENNLREVIQKKIRRYKGKKNAYQKIMRSLASRGFECEEIFKQMENLGIELYDENR